MKDFHRIQEKKTKKYDREKIYEVICFRKKFQGQKTDWLGTYPGQQEAMRNLALHTMRWYMKQGLESEDDIIEYYQWLMANEGPEDVGISEEEPSKEPSGSDWLFNDDYVYNSDNDVYVTFLRVAPKPVTVPGAKHRAMKRAYSDWDGQPATINQICRQFGIPRNWFVEYKRVHGWTHDSEPFVDEEVLERDEEDMVEEALQMRRQSLFQKFEKAKWKDTKDAAERWHKLDQYLLQPLAELADAKREQIIELEPLDLGPAQSSFAVVMGSVDLHYGKAGWAFESGDNYGREEAAQLLNACTDFVLADVLKHGKPIEIIVPIGNDWLDMDNEKGQTAQGTPRFLDGTPAQVLDEGFDLALHHILRLKTATDLVRVIYVPGNHDPLLGQAMAKFLAAYFRDDHKVMVDTKPDDYKFGLFGNAMFAFTHKPIKDMAARMAHRAPKMWGKSLHRAVFYGHEHHEEVEDKEGVLQIIMPSLTGTDRWHSRGGYDMARRAMGAYRIHAHFGVIGSSIAPIEVMN